MPVHSIKEQCIQHVVKALEGIKQDDGFNLSIASVQRVLQGGDVSQSVRALPVIFLTEGEETINPQPLGYVTKQLLLGVDIQTTQDQHKQYASVASACNAIEADIERAILNDTQRGGLAIDTSYVGREEIRQDDDAIEFRMRFLLVYRHKFGNPYEAV